METQIHSNNSIVDCYFGILENLDLESKLELISKLSSSLKEDNKGNASLKSIYGAYQSVESPEEIIKSIRDSRVSNRIIESL